MEIHQIKRSDSDFQQAVDEDELRLQLTRELTDETIISVNELDAGLFNNTYRVHTSNNNYILKIAPEPGADVFYNERYLMQREQSIASQLQALSPLIPQYLSFFTIDNRKAFLQPFIDGKLWHDIQPSLSDTENAILWKQLGAFAKLLHAHDGDHFGYPAPFNNFNRWSQFIEDNVEGMISDCRRLNVLHQEIETYRNYLPHFQQQLDQVKTAKLLHGDLWPRNVIIDGSGSDIHIKAVIDAERAFWGDPASDWVLILYGVPEHFWQGYGHNLIKTHDPVCIAIYKGMYFILNILEAVRFKQTDTAPRKWLSDINDELKQYL